MAAKVKRQEKKRKNELHSVLLLNKKILIYQYHCELLFRSCFPFSCSDNYRLIYRGDQKSNSINQQVLMPETEFTDQELLDLLKTDGEKAIDELFRRYYAYICRSVYRIIPYGNIVEDLAQDVFYELWKKRETIAITTSVKAYLRRAIRNKALNYIRDQRIKFDDSEDVPETIKNSTGTPRHLETKELEKKIEEAIDKLPERCRIVFSLSRFEEMSYAEIAKELNISPKTVENQISKALKHLRKEIEPYLQS